MNLTDNIIINVNIIVLFADIYRYRINIIITNSFGHESDIMTALIEMKIKHF